MLIDTHAHLYWDSYRDDLASVVRRASEKDIKTIINVGVDLESSQEALGQIGHFPELTVYATAGIHPHEAVKYSSDASIHKGIEQLEIMCQKNTGKIVAVGECGLDFFFRENPGFNPTSLPQDQIKKLQMKLYRAQVDLAKKLNLPVIIHCRDGASSNSAPTALSSAWQEIFVPELRDTRGVFHSFTGTPDDVLRALEIGFYLSFSCIVTYPKNEELRQILKATPLDKILTETDCPFLPPQQIRGQRNEPANVAEVVKVIAEVKGISFEKAATQTYQNARVLFHLPS